MNKKRKKQFLTKMEIFIMILVAFDFSTAEIAQKLFLSKETVETHRKNINRKTGCRNPKDVLLYVICAKFTTVKALAAKKIPVWKQKKEDFLKANS